MVALAGGTILNYLKGWHFKETAELFFFCCDTKKNKRTNLAYTLVTDHIFFQVSCWSHEPITFPFGSYLKSRRRTETETNSWNFIRLTRAGLMAVEQSAKHASLQLETTRVVFFFSFRKHTQTFDPPQCQPEETEEPPLSNPSSTSPRRGSAREVCQLWRKTAGSCRLNRANQFGVERKN